MQLNEQEKKTFIELVRMIEDISMMRGAEQVKLISEMSREFARLTVKDPNLGAAATLFKRIADYDQADRDEALTLFIAEITRQVNA